MIAGSKTAGEITASKHLTYPGCCTVCVTDLYCLISFSSVVAVAEKVVSFTVVDSAAAGLAGDGGTDDFSAATISHFRSSLLQTTTLWWGNPPAVVLIIKPLRTVEPFYLQGF